jgi:phosphate-selective porin OprO/OprP
MQMQWRTMGSLLLAMAGEAAMAEPTWRQVGDGWHLPMLQDADGDVTAQLGGRLHLDVVKFDDDNRLRDNASGVQVRRAWVHVLGKAYGFDYRVAIDNADRTRSWKSVYIRHRLGPGSLTVGQFKPAFSLDDTISSDDIMLMERAYVATQLAPLFRLGVAYQGRGPANTTYAITRYRLNDLDGVRASGNAHALRLTWAPVHDAVRTLHVGLSLADETYDRLGNAARPPTAVVTPAGPKARRSQLRLFRIRDGLPVEAHKYAVELAGRAGPWSLQGETGGAVFGDGVQRAVVRTSYLQASYFLRGQGQPYNAGTGRFDTVDAPAWSLTARYDYITASQRPLGQAVATDYAVHNWKLGTTWYVDANTRLMLNLIDGRERDRLRGTLIDHTRAISARVQFIF